MKKTLSAMIAFAVFAVVEILCFYFIVETAKVSLRMISETPLSQLSVFAVMMFAFVFTLMCVVAVAAIPIFCLAVELVTKNS